MSSYVMDPWVQGSGSCEETFKLSYKTAGRTFMSFIPGTEKEDIRRF